MKAPRMAMNQWRLQLELRQEARKELAFVVAQTGQPASGSTRCMSINPADPDARIAEIEGKLELLVSCTPAVLAEGEGDDVLNLDYLRASSVPYTVYVRKAPRGSMRSRLPEFDESVCDAE